MRSIFAAAILAFIPSGVFAQQDLKCDIKNRDYFDCQERELKSYLGKYLCVVDHVAGIQYEDELGKTQPFVGGIRPAEDRFFMEITEDSSLSCGSLIDRSFETGECRTKYAMSFKSKNRFLQQTGYSASFPGKFITASGQMLISAGGKYRGYSRSGWHSYIFEGRCEKLN
jgi:hypothetical protein